MGMDFRGLVWKRVRKNTFLGPKSGKDLENRAAHPHQEFPGVPPRGQGLSKEIKLQKKIAFPLKTGHPKDSTQSHTI